jgi:hypothetical protein
LSQSEQRQGQIVSKTINQAIQQEKIDSASALVGVIIDQTDVSTVGFLARQVAALLRSHNIDDVFAALALVMVDVVNHYNTPHNVTLTSFHMLVKENVQNLLLQEMETVQ